MVSVLSPVQSHPDFTRFLDYEYTDFGGDAMEQDLLYDISNTNINEFDYVDEDEDDDDFDSYDDEDDSYGEEDIEASEYAYALNLPSTDFAVDLVGKNRKLCSWVENKLNGFDSNSIAEYERITFEIEKSNHLLKLGLESIYRYYGQPSVAVTPANIEFCKRLFNQFCNIVLELSSSMATCRDDSNNIVVANDVLEVLKSLGRPVYFNKEDTENNMEDDMITDVDDQVFNSFIDKEMINVLIDIVRGPSSISADVYSIIHNSYEDFLCTLIDNALKLQREYRQGEEISVDDLKLVLQMWKSSPCNTGSFLIQRMDIQCI